ncbi:MAG: hypothetical protein IJH65_01860 [Methanobrevibacter sp.]|nr:hypothetical protein [Methanobrevibacter sp.]
MTNEGSVYWKTVTHFTVFVHQATIALLINKKININEKKYLTSAINIICGYM